MVRIYYSFLFLSLFTMARRSRANDSSDDTDDSITRELDTLEIDDDLPEPVEIPEEAASIKDFREVSIQIIPACYDCDSTLNICRHALRFRCRMASSALLCAHYASRTQSSAAVRRQGRTKLALEPSSLPPTTSSQHRFIWLAARPPILSVFGSRKTGSCTSASPPSTTRILPCAMKPWPRSKQPWRPGPGTTSKPRTAKLI